MIDEEECPFTEVACDDGLCRLAVKLHCEDGTSVLYVFDSKDALEAFVIALREAAETVRWGQRFEALLDGP